MMPPPPNCLSLVRLLLCGLMVGLPLALGGGAGEFAHAAEVRNPDGVAVIVGNKEYAEVGDVAYAHRDAKAFRHYVVDVLGFDPRNVRLVTDADFGKMRSLFGTEGRPGILGRFVEKRHELSGGRNVSDVVVFYSGHGLPSLTPGETGSYLVAVDANPHDPAHNGYSVEELYRVLGALPARSVSVFLDACFSGVGGDGTPLLRASPAVMTRLPDNVGANTVVFAAAEAQQIAFWDDEAGHGLFTHHLLDALYGGGDEDGDGRVTSGEVQRYLAEHVWYAALDTHGREQDAVLIDGTGTAATVLAAAVDGAFPTRPDLGVPDAVASDEGTDTTPAVVDHAAVELSLGLERSEKKLVQRGLASAGYSAGDIDGIVGGKTREALGTWQTARGDVATGYLTADQAKALIAAGETAQREQATREQAERERREKEKAERELAAREQAAREARDKREAERRAREEAERKARPEESSPAAKKLSGLLRRPFSPTAVDENGWTDLHYAAVLNMPEVAKALLHAGAEPEARLLDDGAPLTGEVAQAMRLMGRPLDRWNRNGHTALYMAAAWNSGDTARELIAGGAYVNATSAGWTPLQVAAWNNADTATEVLISGLADVNARDGFGRTSLHIAAMQNARKAAEKLIAGHANLEAQTIKPFESWGYYEGATPLHMAAGYDARETAELLIDRGAKVGARQRQGKTPLHIAAQANSYRTAELLISRDANIGAIDRFGETPLHDAAHDSDAYDVAKLLIENGANVNAMPYYVDVGQRRRMWAPLHRAAWRNAMQVAKLLLDNGANVNLLDEDGCSPMDKVDADTAAERAKMEALLRRYGGRTKSSC